MPREKHMPPEPARGGGKAFFVSPKTMEQIKKLLGRTDVELDPTQFEMIEKAGVRHYRLRVLPEQSDNAAGGGGNIPFAVSLITVPGEVPTYKVTVDRGYVIERIPGAVEPLDYHLPENLFDGDELREFPITPGQSVYVKVNVDKDGGIVLPEESEDEYAVFILVAEDEIESLNPVSSGPPAPGYYYYKLAFLQNVGGGALPVLVSWMTGSHIEYERNAVPEIFHPWKIEYAGVEDVEVEGVPVSQGQWLVRKGAVYTQGTPVTILETTVSGDAGTIAVKITRDAVTREMTGAVVEFYETLPESDYNSQYVVLAEVDKEGSPQVEQHRFEDLRIFEDLVVVNGEFQLVDLLMAGRNFYEIPPV